MIRLVCYHGWGLSPAFWNPLRDELLRRIESVDFQAVDLGYRTEERQWNVGDQGLPSDELQFESNEPAEDWIAIGHSLGFAKLLGMLQRQNHPIDFLQPKGLVSINGFTRFCQSESQTAGTHPRILRRMIRAFAQDADAVLNQFHANAGLSADDAESLNCGLNDLPRDRQKNPEACKKRKLNQSLLARDLSLLESINQSSNLLEFRNPVLVLAGQKDSIVSPELTQSCFESATIAWHDSAQHMIPVNYTQWCADQIVRFVKELR